MGRYSLTESAAIDFELIFEFGIDVFGLEQALTYQNNLTRRFEKMADNPELYPAVDDIRKGYRRSVYQSHSIFYRVEGENIIIVRILGQQDTKTAF